MPEGLPTIQPAKTVEYTTPRDLFDELWDEVGGFDMDPFCRPHHYTAQKVLGNGGTICIPSSSAYTSGSWLAALPYGLRSQVLVDGLAHPWHGKVWFQPPYGLPLAKSVPYAVHQIECGNTELVMGLLPAKTEVQWWQKYIMTRAQAFGGHNACPHIERHPLAKDVRFLKGRLSFGGSDGGPARVGNVIVVWRK